LSLLLFNWFFKVVPAGEAFLDDFGYWFIEGYHVYRLV